MTGPTAYNPQPPRTPAEFEWQLAERGRLNAMETWREARLDAAHWRHQAHVARVAAVLSFLAFALTLATALLAGAR